MAYDLHLRFFSLGSGLTVELNIGLMGNLMVGEWSIRLRAPQST
jgi:hypothetical protein